MRRFLIVGHTQPSTAPIPLNDAPGAGGRWDVLARCVTTGLLVSHGLRRDTEVLLWLSRGPRLVRVSGAGVRNLNPDERSTLALLSKALENVDVATHETANPPGFATSRRTLDEALASSARDGPIVWLTEDAPAPVEFSPGGSVTFVLSDHRDPTADEAATIAKHETHRASLGPVALQADQCIALAHNRLDLVARLRSSAPDAA